MKVCHCEHDADIPCSTVGCAQGRAPTPKPSCAAAGTHAGQPWQCERDGKEATKRLGRLCSAHYRQWQRAKYPEAFEFKPLRTYEAGAERAELRLYVPSELAEGLRERAASKGCSVAALCRPALSSLLDDDS